MLYELHITAEQVGPVGALFWQQRCEMTGSKPLLIELHGTPNPNVQMMNATTTECDPDQVGRWTVERCAAVKRFKIQRVKLEVPLDKGFVVYPSVAYHECHVKALVRPEDVVSFRNEATRNGWVVSRNLFFEELGGYEKWYLTQRRYDMPALRAGNEFCYEWAELQPRLAGVATARMEMESVVSDSNPELDEGWAI
jgi:hypothetical protein